MRIPSERHPTKRLDFYQEVSAACLASRQRRMEQYARYRAYYLYGAADGESAWNLIYSHLDTVTSFLYASDSTRFSVRMGSNAPKSDYSRTDAFAKRVMEEWKTSNADIMYQMAILWALVYDSALVKHIRRGGAVHPFVVDPGSFGVYREDVPMLDRQEAFVHVWYMTESDLEKRLAIHPNRRDILDAVSAAYSKKDISSSMPPIVERVTLSSFAQNGVGMDNVVGEANIPLSSPPDYQAEVSVPLIEMQELWVWNDAEDDYQVCTMAAESAIVYDRANIFIPRTREWEAEQPFVQVCPNPLPDYFWGQSEVSKLAPIQDKLEKRMGELERLEEKQVDPPSAWGGMGLPEDKMSAFNDAGAQIAISDPNFKRESFIPQVPEHVYASVDRFQAQMDVVSGLPNVVQGKGESGVRSAGHAGKLLTVGSARAKKRGMIIEDSLEKGATLYGRCLYVDETEELFDEHDTPFLPSQMSPHFFVEVDAHSNSPVFMENQQQMADRLLKARAINRKRYIQMNHPPMEDELIRDLETKIIPAEEKAAQMDALAEAAKGQGKLKAVS